MLPPILPFHLIQEKLLVVSLIFSTKTGRGISVHAIKKRPNIRARAFQVVVVCQIYFFR